MAQGNCRHPDAAASWASPIAIPRSSPTIDLHRRRAAGRARRQDRDRPPHRRDRKRAPGQPAAQQDRRLDLRQSAAGLRAWELIDRAGCRGLKVGGAQVSEKHCNFLINTGDATAYDVEALGEEVRRRVFASHRRGAAMGDQAHRRLCRRPEADRGGSALMSGMASHSAQASRHVAVLMGGFSAEREVSLVTGQACVDGAARGRLQGHQRST